MVKCPKCGYEFEIEDKTETTEIAEDTTEEQATETKEVA
jgi:DNA-directed RNA polymerase subunit M/transcription elongation factor TFIIS